MWTGSSRCSLTEALPASGSALELDQSECQQHSLYTVYIKFIVTIDVLERLSFTENSRCICGCGGTAPTHSANDANCLFPESHNTQFPVSLAPPAGSLPT